MIKLDSRNSLAAMSLIGGAISEFRLHAQLIAANIERPLVISHERRQSFLNALICLKEIANDLNLVSARAAVTEAVEYCSHCFVNIGAFSSADLNNIFGLGDRVLHAFSSEMDARIVFVMSTAHADFYSPVEPLFGRSVEHAFPSASADISEAGKCRSLGRWTACVMHLMRALEPALLALQAEVQVNAPKEQWDQIINQIEAKIREISGRTHGKVNEQWYSEAASHFRLIKNAWRNRAQHLHDRYDEERAVEIYNSVQAFMRHLATRLSERPS